MKKRSIRTIYGLAILAGVILLRACPVQAALVTIQISGEITSAHGPGLPSGINAGDTFTGTYTYDSSTLDSEPDPKIGEYLHDSPYGMSISVGGYEFKTASTHIGQFEIGIENDVTDNDNNTFDYYLVYSDENAYTDGCWISSISWRLRDSTYYALSSDALPSTAPILEDWDYNHLDIDGGNAGEGYVNFWINGTVTQAIPEPMTGILLVAGILFLRRRR